MNKKILILFVVVCLIATAECKKKKNKNSHEQNRSGEKQLESCITFCERRERQRTRELSDGYSSGGHSSGGKKKKGHSRERRGLRLRRGGKSHERAKNVRQEELDCEC